MKLISNQLCPHFHLNDGVRMAKKIFSLNKKNDHNFSALIGTKDFLLTNTARVSLGVLVDILELPRDKKIGIPAFCCCVMATPFLGRGHQIQWLDTDKNGLLDPASFAAHADQINLLLVPHIFGQRADMSSIMKIAKEHNVLVVEDGAHCFLPMNEIQGDLALLSFGREKDISCVSGGALIWRDQTPFAKELRNVSLNTAPSSWTVRHLLQPLILSLALPWWRAGGKIITFAAKKLNLLPRAVTQAEKEGFEDRTASHLPNPLQDILHEQMKGYPAEIKRRKKIAEVWKRILSHHFPPDHIIVPDNAFRVILKTDQQQKIITKAKNVGFDLREWDGHPIAPKGADLQAFGYTRGQCPAAEHFAAHYVTFPTNRRVSVKDVEKFGKIILHEKNQAGAGL